MTTTPDPTAGTLVAHYRGDHVAGIIAAGEARTLFGPDRAGDTFLNADDVRAAFRTGVPDAIRRHIATAVNPRGAFYEAVGADYDPAVNMTTAYFRPYIDPRQRIRSYGGTIDPNEQLSGPTLHRHDNIKGR